MSELGSPTPVRLYSRHMAEAFNEKDFMGVPSCFLSFFGRQESGSKTVYQADKLEIDVDIMRANERIAQLVPRGMQAKSTTLAKAQKTKFTERNMIFPLGEEETTIDANQLFFRQLGENPYDTKTRLQRMRMLAFDAHLEHARRFTRMFEFLAAYSIINGKMPALIGTSDTSLLYDFKRLATHTFTAAASWATASTNIIGDLDTACDLIRKDAHVRPDIALCGQTAITGILNNTTILARADNRRLQQVSLVTDTDVPKKYQWMSDAGWEFRGVLKTSKGYSLHLFSSIEGYDNASGTFTKYLGNDQCVVGSTDARCDRYFGPPERMPMTPSEIAYYQELFGFAPKAMPLPQNIKNGGSVLSPEMFFYDVYKGSNHKNITLRTQTAPLFAPTMTDAWVTIDVTP